MPKVTAALIAFSLLAASAAQAQIPRERADPGAPVEDIFWAPKVILTNSVYNLPRRNLNVTIMHAFGLANRGAHHLFGLDDTANIRLGLDYGVSDRFSVGIGRSRFDKLYDARFQYNVLRQTQDDRMPIELAVTGTVGHQTLDDGTDFSDRLNYFGAVMVGRQFSHRIRMQASPMVSHFSTPLEPGAETTQFAVGLAGNFVLSRRVAFLVEYVPVISSRTPGTRDALSFGFDIDTGGHVFQLFFTTSQWLTEQHVISRNAHNFFDGDFRIGFNVNRVFRI